MRKILNRSQSCAQRGRASILFVFVVFCLAVQTPFSQAIAQENELADFASAPLPSDRSVAAAEAVADDAIKSYKERSRGSFPYNPFRSLTQGLGHLVDRESQITLALGAAGVLGARPFDRRAQAYFKDKPRIGKAATHFTNHVMGSGMPGALLGASFWLAGDLLEQPYATHAGQAQIEALLMTSVITAAMKSAFGRERPDGSDNYSFPSGHSSLVFASASVLTEFYGWRMGVPAYLLGAVTMVGRMQDNRHWLSDTIGGAAVGILVGRAFARAHLAKYKATESSSSLSVHPAFEKGGAKLVFRWTF